MSIEENRKFGNKVAYSLIIKTIAFREWHDDNAEYLDQYNFPLDELVFLFINKIVLNKGDDIIYLAVQNNRFVIIGLQWRKSYLGKTIIFLKNLEFIALPEDNDTTWLLINDINRNIASYKFIGILRMKFDDEYNTDIWFNLCDDILNNNGPHNVINTETILNHPVLHFSPSDFVHNFRELKNG